MSLQKIEIPELSLSPWRMLGPVRHRFCRVLLFSLFDWRTRCLYALHLRYRPALRSKVFVAYQPSAVSTGMLNASMQHQSVLPNSGNILLRYSGRYTLSKARTSRKRGATSFFNIFLSKNWLFHNLPSDQAHETRKRGL